MNLWWQIFITFLILAIEIITLYYIYFFKKRGDIVNIIDEAVQQAKFAPTIFKIYDKSTSDVCNRLIVVAPFDWYIWACRGELYVVNPEGGIRCSPDTTPAVRVFADQFVETCLKLNMSSILEAYTNGKIPKIVPYEINDTTFTVLSALNILMKKWVTFDKNITANTSMRLLQDDDDTNYKTADGAKVFHMHGRLLSKDDVVRITTQTTNKVHHAKLHKHLLKHTPKQTNYSLADYNVEDLNVNHPAYITQRQHANNHHENLPKLLR